MIDTGIKEREGVDRKLPDGWKWVKVGEIATVVRGSSPRPKDDPMYYGGTVPRLMVADVTRDGMYVTPKIDFLTEEGAKLSRPMKKDDVVMVVSGAPGLPGILAVDACIHDGFVGFKNVDSTILLNTFFFSYLKFVHVSTDSQATGTIFRNLTTDQIKDIKIPLPPLAEQKRIAAILNEQMEAVEKARKATEEQLEAAKELPAAYLRAVFNSPDAQKWEKVKMADICEFKNGINFSSNQKGKGILTVDVLNMYSDSIYVSMNELYRVNIQIKDEYLLQKNDILFVRSSVKQEGVGWATLFPGYSEQVTFCGFIIRARLNTPKMYPNFLINFFRLHTTRNLIISKSGRGTITNISQGILAEIIIPLPSFTEQKQIAAELSSKMANVETLEKSLKSQFEAINQLPSAILHKAFNGQL